jgi:hypothetical protein
LRCGGFRRQQQRAYYARGIFDGKGEREEREDAWKKERAFVMCERTPVLDESRPNSAL